MIDFSKYKYVSITASFILILAGFIYTFNVHGGFAHSLDFNGGIRVVVQHEDADKDKLDKYFKTRGIDALIIQLNKEKNIYQIDTGLDTINKLEKETTVKGIHSSIDLFIGMLEKDLGFTKENILSGDQVGAVVGNELYETGLQLLISTIVIMVLYLSFRFQFKFALAASVALMHDLLFTLALIGVLQIKPSVPLIAALLTIMGYSINDTIVIFDRIRENLAGNLEQTFSSLINVSIHQTLGRTMNTSFATMISLVAILVGGAMELYDFAFVLILGIIVGTYSSIFIAAPVIEIYDKFVRKH